MDRIFNNIPQVILAVVAGLLMAVATSNAHASDNPLFRNVLEERAEYACLSAKEAELFRLVNEYRESHGLPPIANSRSLNKVARLHAVDLQENRPDMANESGMPCTLHSWSDSDLWTPVCYTPDHRFAEKMWNKPKEITNYQYPGDGYENAYWTAGDEVSAQRVLEAWKNSPSHNALILESGIWKGSNLLSFGIGIHKNVAVMWVGTLVDPLGPMTCTIP